MFTINGVHWKLKRVDTKNRNLRRPDGSVTIGMTDGNSRTVYIEKNLRGRLLDKVLAHELCHCFMFSYNIYMDRDEEEFLADWVSNYGRELVYKLDELTQTIKYNTK